jgi:hypothetical protein
MDVLSIDVSFLMNKNGSGIKLPGEQWNDRRLR